MHNFRTFFWEGSSSPGAFGPLTIEECIGVTVHVVNRENFANGITSFFFFFFVNSYRPRKSLFGNFEQTVLTEIGCSDLLAAKHGGEQQCVQQSRGSVTLPVHRLVHWAHRRCTTPHTSPPPPTRHTRFIPTDAVVGVRLRQIKQNRHVGPIKPVFPKVSSSHRGGKCWFYDDVL